MIADQYPTVDFADFPSIVVPLSGALGVDTHSHPQHQLTWSPEGVLTMVVDSSRWVVQRSRALWIPGGVAHSVVNTSSCEMLSLYFEPGDCPLRWEAPTVIDATAMVGPLLSYLVSLPEGALEQRARGRAVLWDLVKPMAVTAIPTIVPSDPQARAVASAIKEDRRG